MIFLIAACCILTGAFLYQETKGRYVPAVILKGMASLCFVIIGTLGSPGTHAAKLIVWGLIIDAVGDILHGLRKVFKEKEQVLFLVGTLFFLAGHILYLIAVFPLSGNRLVCSVIGVILTGFLLAWIFKWIETKPDLRIFCIVYIGTFVFLNCIAIGNMISSASFFTGLFAGGALLYLISDIILILNTFGAEFKQELRYTSIWLYYAGQLLIALSLGMM